jgi:hypothetical protein
MKPIKIHIEGNPKVYNMIVDTEEELHQILNAAFEGKDVITEVFSTKRTTLHELKSLDALAPFGNSLSIL